MHERSHAQRATNDLGGNVARGKREKQTAPGRERESMAGGLRGKGDVRSGSEFYRSVTKRKEGVDEPRRCRRRCNNQSFGSDPRLVLLSDDRSNRGRRPCFRRVFVHPRSPTLVSRAARDEGDRKRSTFPEAPMRRAGRWAGWYGTLISSMGSRLVVVRRASPTQECGSDQEPSSANVIVSFRSSSSLLLRRPRQGDPRNERSSTSQDSRRKDGRSEATESPAEQHAPVVCLTERSSL